MPKRNCPICLNEKAVAVANDGSGPRGICPRCGDFKVGWQIGLPVFDITSKQRTNLSSWNREHQGAEITAANLAELLKLETPGVVDRADKVLLFLAEKFPLVGEDISTAATISIKHFKGDHRFAPAKCASEDDLLGVSWSESTEELEYLIFDYLVSEKEYLKFTAKEYFRITPKGWAHLKLLNNTNPPIVKLPQPSSTYIDPYRIEELRAIRSTDFDVTKLIRLCEELNCCLSSENYFSMIMLTRAIIDHTPPIFRVSTFSQVANNYAGSKSFRESMQHLENSSRKIADQHLHCQIRKSETIPTYTQVNFSNDLDVLLAEIVRLLK